MTRLSPRVLLPLTALAISAAPALPALAAPTGGGGNIGTNGKVTICHRTHSTTNPYRKITISISAANANGPRDHSSHLGPVFDPAKSYPANAKVWGDIIPDGLNWTADGQALAAGPLCGAMTAQEYYNGEIEAGQSPADVQQDLQEQGATEDKGLDLTTITYTGTDPQYLPTPAPTPAPTVPVVDPTPTVPVTVDPTPTVAPTTDPVPTLDPVPTTAPTVPVEPTLPEVLPTADPTVDPTAPAPEPTVPVVPPAVDPTPTVDVPTLPPVTVPPVTVPPVDPTPTTPVDEPSVPAVDPTPSVPAVDPTPPAGLPEVPVVVPTPSAPGSDPVTVPVPVTTTVTTSRVLRLSAYLDLNGNGSWNAGEPGLPGLPVSLDGKPAGTTDQAGRASHRVGAGAHTLRLTVPSALGVTGTSDSLRLATLVVPASATSGWWALRGTAALQGAGSQEAISWTWAGVDGVLGTSDDVSGVGTGTVSGLPAGSYRVNGSAARLSPRQTLDLGGAGASALPFTGDETGGELAAGVALVLVGGALTGAARRRRTAL